MKTFCLSHICLLLLGSCLVLNETGLNPGHITGDEAADRIQNAAIVVNAAVTAAVLGTPYVTDLNLLADTLAGIERDKYYKESEVDDCVSDMYRLKWPEAFFGSTYVAIKCELQPDNILIDP